MGSSEASTEPTGEQIQNKSNSLIECENYRWYMKMQAWTSPSHDNAHIPKKMFQATSWSSYNDHGREIVPPTILLFWNEIVIQIQPQSLPTWYEILKCYSFVPTQLSFYSPNVFHQYYPLGGNLKWRLLKSKNWNLCS